MPKSLISLLLFIIVSLGGNLCHAETRIIEIPLTLDFSLLRSFLVRQAYKGPMESAQVVNKDEGCTQIKLWNPVIGRENENLKITNQIKVKAGVKLLGMCLDPVTWQGKVEVIQSPAFDPDTWIFSVKTLDSRLLDEKGEPAFVANIIYSLVQEYVHAYLDQFKVNLSTPKRDLEIQLPLFFKDDKRREVESWLKTLRPGLPEMTDQGVKIELAMRVAELVPTEQEEELPDEEVVADLTQGDRQAFIKYWETWDAYLVREIKALAGEPLTRKEKDVLLEVVLKTRHQFFEILDSGHTDQDLVRKQFLWSWQRLAPILRHHLLDEPHGSLFSFLSFFTAADALAVLDRLGPSLGLEISESGLMRLARLVAKDQKYHSLSYSYERDSLLQKILGLPPLPPPTGPGLDVEDIPLEDFGVDDREQRSGRIWDWLVKPAWAGKGPTGLEEIKPWLYWRTDSEKYFKAVFTLVDHACQDALAKDGLDPKYHELFLKIARASAWQESCWRQFIKKDKSVTYLRSYNQSSVGLMQINERVWRGVYEPKSLCWDIKYNVRAGAGILELYFRRYALKRLGNDHNLDDSTLAGLIYAMYNGGPGQYKKYLKRHAVKKYWLSDRLFAEKFTQVKAGDLGKCLDCLRTGG